MNHSNIAHRWANNTDQNLSKGSSSLFFEGASIYSYGHHFEIARKLSDGRTLFTKDSYSNSTAKHKSHVYGAIQYNAIEVSTFFALEDSKETKNKAHKSNIEYIVAEIEEQNKKLKNARKPEIYLSKISDLQNEIVDYIKDFNVPKYIYKFYSPSLDEFSTLWQRLGKIDKAKARKYKSDLKKAEAYRKQKAIENLKHFNNTALPQFLEHVGSYLQHPIDSNLTYLRLSKDGTNIQTSKGIILDLNEAKRLYTFIDKLNGEHWQRNGKQYAIGNHYSLDTINSNGDLFAGCHTIQNEEIKRFAATQNW